MIRDARNIQHGPRRAVHRKDFTDVLKEHHIAISMDGRGCWRDNVFYERMPAVVKRKLELLRTSRFTMGSVRIQVLEAKLQTPRISNKSLSFRQHNSRGST